MENHYFDADGAYSGTASATPGSFPPDNAVRLAPPRRDGYWPVLDQSRTAWLLVEDNRGRSGFVHGQAATMVRLGPLPEGWSDKPPAETAGGVAAALEAGRGDEAVF